RAANHAVKYLLENTVWNSAPRWACVASPGRSIACMRPASPQSHRRHDARNARAGAFDPGTGCNPMSVDFAYASAASYRTYLAGLHQREKIDIAIAKSVRAAVGSVTEVYGGDRPVLRAAVRDLRSVPGSPCEVLTVN